MFLSYYGFDEQPFGVTPDAGYFYMSDSHKEAFASLLYGIQSGRGFLALIAFPGMGKTTVLFHLMEHLQKSSRTVFLFQTQGNSVEFLSNVVSDLGMTPVQGGLRDLQNQLNDVLLREAQLGRQFVLIIDEAQNLQDDVLETVRMLSNFETSNSKLMQIVLAGQPQLADKLTSAGLTQLRQRVSVISHLDPLNAEDGVRYIDNRLKVAGYKGRGPLFTQDAMRMLLEKSEGIPRNINNICFHALSLGYAKRQKTIDASIVAEVLADLNLELLGSESRQPSPAVPESPQTNNRLRPETEQKGPSNPPGNPWYRADQPEYSVRHPLIRAKRNWFVRTCVLLALLIACGLVWDGVRSHSGFSLFAFGHFRHALFTSRHGRQTSAGPEIQKKSESAGDAISGDPRSNASGQQASAGNSGGTPSGVAKGTAQPGNRSVTDNQETSQVASSAKHTVPTVGANKGVDQFHTESIPSAMPTRLSARGSAKLGRTAAVTPGGHPRIPLNHDFGELVMEANFNGARVFINGQSKPGWLTPHTFSLRPGTYWVQVTKHGHPSWSGSLHVTKGRTKWTVADLGRSSGVILIETNPSRIPVFIDSEAYGPSPVESTLSAGRHTYKVIPKNGSKPYTGSFVLKAASLLRIKVKWPASKQHKAKGTSGQSALRDVGYSSKGGTS